jgi:hypothetical protein
MGVQVGFRSRNGNNAARAASTQAITEPDLRHGVRPAEYLLLQPRGVGLPGEFTQEAWRKFPSTPTLYGIVAAAG